MSFPAVYLAAMSTARRPFPCEADRLSAAAWLQDDSRTLYLTATVYRDSGYPGDEWVAGLVQKNAAYHSAMAREILGIES